MMYAVRNVNSFFESRYLNLADFALAPVSLMRMSHSHTTFNFSMDWSTALFCLFLLPVMLPIIVTAMVIETMINYITELLLYPIVIPSTIATVSIAMALAAVTGIMHGLALAGAGVADAVSMCVC